MNDLKAVTNTPIYSLIAFALMIGFAVIVVVTGHGEDDGGALLIGLAVTTIPSLVAALYSERTSRDVRNGVVVEKVRQGTHVALKESGVQEVVDMSQRGETTLVAMQALTKLLERREATDSKSNDSVTGVDKS